MLRITAYGDVTRIDLTRTLAGRGQYWTTAYAVDGLLVDSGCVDSVRELSAVLTNGPGPIKIVNTHSHEDHIGANGMLQRHFAAAQILAHPLALPVLLDPRRAQPLHLYRHIMWGRPEPSRGLPLADGDVMTTARWAALQAKIAHLEQLGETALALEAQGWSVPQIQDALCGGPMPIELITLGHFSRRWLIRSYLDGRQRAAY